MLIVGLTGSISTGKSTVSSRLTSLSVPVFDCDQNVHDILNGEAQTKIVELFSPHVSDLVVDGKIDRARLGNFVFEQKEWRRALNQIVHPMVKRRMIKWILWKYILGNRMVVLDIPLLYELNMDRYMSKTIVVYCREDQQLERLMKRDQMDETRARLRIGSQMSIEEKKTRADLVVDNSGTLEETHAQVDALVERMMPGKVITWLWWMAGIGMLCGGLVGIGWMGYGYSKQM